MTAFRSLLRILLAIAAAGLLVGCSGLDAFNKANQPLPASLVAHIHAIGSSEGEAMIIRIFKQDSELEVWKRTKNGTYAYLKSYEICSYSGDLGPKIKEGDRQAPEGFYSITPGLMNPHSSYYLAFNTGFPNKFDRVWGRTGSELMVHGDCTSRGCYAMTDEQIAEIYALGREAFKGGQRTFQLQIFPFRMTVANMAKYHANPNIDFWRDLKVGYDTFEMSKRDVNWDVCEKRYIFNPAGGPLDPAGACPTTYSDPVLMAAVSKKEKADAAAIQVAAADFDAKAARAEADRVAQEKEQAEIAARTAALNAAVDERGEAIVETVSGFFANVWSGITGGGQPAAVGQVVPNAPYPAPRLQRS